MTLPNSLRQLAAGPIFVIGAPRSGTTWVYDALSAHPEVAGALETWMFTRRMGFGGLFSWAQWDPAHGSRAEELVGAGMGVRNMISREELVRDIRELSAGWLSRVLEPGHRFLVEKSPPHLHVAHVIAEVFPEAMFVNVVRDGRDVAVSMKAAATSWNPGWTNDTRDVRRTAQEWKRAVAQGRALAERLEGRIIEVRYEQISAEPKKHYRRLFDFCGIPCDDGLLERIVSDTDFAHRFQGGEDRFRRRGKIGDWRATFGLRDAFAFHRVAGDELIRSGYEQSATWWLRVPRRSRANDQGSALT